MWAAERQTPRRAALPFGNKRHDCYGAACGTPPHLSHGGCRSADARRLGRMSHVPPRESQSEGRTLGAAPRRALAAQRHRPIFGRVGKRACAGRRAARGKEGKGERGKEGEREREGGRGREGEGERETETDRNEKFSEMRLRDLCNNFFERNSQK